MTNRTPSNNSPTEELVALKPCPFCGDEGVLSSYRSCDCCGKEWNGKVTCQNEACGAEVSHFDSNADAIAAWNTRQSADLIERLPDVEREGWRCFHCGGHFTDESAARLHFGREEGATPACIIKGADGGLLRALRDAEQQADEAVQMMHNESTDAAKAYHRQRCRHTQALIAAEEAGYERGLADGRSLPARQDEVGVTQAELFTLDQIEQAYEAWRAGDVPQPFMKMMREDGWFMAGKQSRAEQPAIASMDPVRQVAMELREALTVGEDFLNKCFSAWSCGEPHHRVKAMLDAADKFRETLSALASADAVMGKINEQG